MDQFYAITRTRQPLNLLKREPACASLFFRCHERSAAYSASMKLYHGRYSAGARVVTVDGQALKMRRHAHDTRVSPFAWGEHAVGAERLAYSILADCIGDGFAVWLAVPFMNDVVSKLDAEWEITSEDIEAWHAFRHQLGYSFQAAARSPRELEANEPAPIRPDWPLLVGNPNYRIGTIQPSAT